VNLLAALLLAPSLAHAVDPTPQCFREKLVPAAKAISQLGACHARAIRTGAAVDARCEAAAIGGFARRYDRVERSTKARFCLDDDGVERLRRLVAGVVDEARLRLAPGTDASSCQAAKLEAAAARAASTLLAEAATFFGSASPRPAHARVRRLTRLVGKARRRFAARFARLERRGGCATSGDARAVGGAVDATLDVLAAGLNLVTRETGRAPSPVTTPHTPGAPGVVVTNAKLLTQFGNADFSLSNVTYTRWRVGGPPPAPDAIVILVPGFGGGAGNFEALAENLIQRMREDHAMIVEVWGFDRRSEQLEDREGLLVAGRMRDPLVGLDWYYGADLGLPLSPGLARRAVFYNDSDDVPFLAEWTSLLFSRDIDVVVEAARAASRGGNVFLGGHSAGTGFAARYAATDLNVTGSGVPKPGYAKLRGLVLLEGTGGSTAGPALTDDALDRIIAKHDGGLFGAVRDAAPRCVDGTTPCTITTEAADCAGQVPAKCTPSGPAHSILLGLDPRVLAAAEPAGVQSLTDPDSGQAILQVDQGAPGNNAIARVPELGLLGVLPPGTVDGLFGSFLDDEGVAAAAAPAFAASIGAPGPTIDGLRTWLDITERASFPPCPGAGCQTPDNGPPPVTLPGGPWGREKEVTRLDRLRTSFAGVEGANASDWYYPISGLGVTTSPGVCTAGACTAGNVGAACADDGDCSQSISLDSTPLSVGRGRPDIENLTQAARIDVPVLCVGGSNGLAPVPGRFVALARSLGVCAAPSCDGTPRVVDATSPNPAFPTFGGTRGGFDVVVAEGFSHLDVVAAEDDADNPVLAAIADFVARNAQ